MPNCVCAAGSFRGKHVQKSHATITHNTIHRREQFLETILHSRIPASYLVEALGRRHGSLDSQASNVLPALLEQRDEVVNGQHDVTNQLILSHLDVANSDTHAQHLLQLELDGRLDFGDLGGKIFGVRDRGRELAGYVMLVMSSLLFLSIVPTLGKTWTQETRDLLDQGVGGDESVVLAGQLLDELLVLVELLQVVGGHGINTVVLRSVDVVLVTENATSSLAINLLLS